MDGVEGETPVRRTARARKVNPRFVGDDIDENYMKLVGRITASNYSSDKNDKESLKDPLDALNHSTGQDDKEGADGEDGTKASNCFITVLPNKSYPFKNNSDNSSVNISLKTISLKRVKKTKKVGDASGNADFKGHPSKPAASVIVHCRSSTESEASEDSLENEAERKRKLDHLVQTNIDLKKRKYSTEELNDSSATDPNISASFPSKDSEILLDSSVNDSSSNQNNISEDSFSSPVNPTRNSSESPFKSLLKKAFVSFSSKIEKQPKIVMTSKSKLNLPGKKLKIVSLKPITSQTPEVNADVNAEKNENLSKGGPVEIKIIKKHTYPMSSSTLPSVLEKDSSEKGSKLLDSSADASPPVNWFSSDGEDDIPLNKLIEKQGVTKKKKKDINKLLKLQKAKKQNKLKKAVVKRKSNDQDDIPLKMLVKKPKGLSGKVKSSVSKKSSTAGEPSVKKPKMKGLDPISQKNKIKMKGLDPVSQKNKIKMSGLKKKKVKKASDDCESSLQELSPEVKEAKMKKFKKMKSKLSKSDVFSMKNKLNSNNKKINKLKFKFPQKKKSLKTDSPLSKETTNIVISVSGLEGDYACLAIDKDHISTPGKAAAEANDSDKLKPKKSKKNLPSKKYTFNSGLVLEQDVSEELRENKSDISKEIKKKSKDGSEMKIENDSCSETKLKTGKKSKDNTELKAGKETLSTECHGAKKTKETAETESSMMEGYLKEVKGEDVKVEDAIDGRSEVLSSAVENKVKFQKEKSNLVVVTKGGLNNLEIKGYLDSPRIDKKPRFKNLDSEDTKVEYKKSKDKEKKREAKIKKEKHNSSKSKSKEDKESKKHKEKHHKSEDKKNKSSELKLNNIDGIKVEEKSLKKEKTDAKVDKGSKKLDNDGNKFEFPSQKVEKEMKENLPVKVKKKENFEEALLSMPIKPPSRNRSIDGSKNIDKKREREEKKLNKEKRSDSKDVKQESLPDGIKHPSKEMLKARESSNSPAKVKSNSHSIKKEEKHSKHREEKRHSSKSEERRRSRHDSKEDVKSDLDSSLSSSDKERKRKREEKDKSSKHSSHHKKHKREHSESRHKKRHSTSEERKSKYSDEVSDKRIRKESLNEDKKVVVKNEDTKDLIINKIVDPDKEPSDLVKRENQSSSPSKNIKEHNHSARLEASVHTKTEMKPELVIDEEYLINTNEFHMKEELHNYVTPLNFNSSGPQSSVKCEGNQGMVPPSPSSLKEESSNEDMTCKQKEKSNKETEECKSDGITPECLQKDKVNTQEQLSEIQQPKNEQDLPVISVADKMEYESNKENEEISDLGILVELKNISQNAFERRQKRESELKREEQASNVEHVSDSVVQSVSTEDVSTGDTKSLSTDQHLNADAAEKNQIEMEEIAKPEVLVDSAIIKETDHLNESKVDQPVDQEEGQTLEVEESKCPVQNETIPNELTRLEEDKGEKNQICKIEKESSQKESPKRNEAVKSTFESVYLSSLKAKSEAMPDIHAIPVPLESIPLPNEMHPPPPAPQPDSKVYNYKGSQESEEIAEKSITPLLETTLTPDDEVDEIETIEMTIDDDEKESSDTELGIPSPPEMDLDLDTKEIHSPPEEGRMEVISPDELKFEDSEEKEEEPIPVVELTPEEKVEMEIKNKKIVEERMKSFELLEENLYLKEKVKNKRSKEAKRMVCDCTLTKEEVNNDEMGCGDDCLNKLLMIECGSRCPLKERCMNKKFQQKKYADVEVFNADMKGCGVRAVKDVEMGTFIMEYMGEVFDTKEFKRRRKEYAKGSSAHFYFMALRSDRLIDATRKGNISRFINHSCDPNAETQKWTVNGEIRIGFFATKPIAAGDEINFDYRLERYGREPQKCFCGTSECRGWLGEPPDQKTKEEKEEDKRREMKDRRRREDRRSSFFEDMDLEDEIEKLCARGLRNRQDTLTLSRLMVRSEDSDSRRRLLGLLESGEEASRRLFLDYHGLKLLWSWMVDISSSHKCKQLKLQILNTLNCLPITNKTQVTDSKVMNIVERWSKAETKEEEKAKDTVEASKEVATDKKASDGSEDSDPEATDTKDSPPNDTVSPDDSSLDSNAAPKEEEEEEEEEEGGEEEAKEEEEEEEESVSGLAARLVAVWSELKEAFRIPKTERIEIMKEHEREVDLEYAEYLDKKMGSIEIRTQAFYDRWRYSSADKEERQKERERRREKWWTRRKEEEEEKGLSKEERRERFAMQVAKEDEEARQRKLQEEMWTLHLERCTLLGHDPYFTPMFDPSGQYYWDPGAKAWQAYVGPSGNLPVPASYSVNRTDDGTCPMMPPSRMFMTEAFYPLPHPPIPDGEGGRDTPPLSLDPASIPLPGEIPPPKPADPPSVVPIPTIPLPEEGNKDPRPSPLDTDGDKSPQAPPGPVTIQLPPKWKIARDEARRIYYYHTKTRHVQWDLPTEDLHAQLVARYGLNSDSESDLESDSDSTSSSDSEDFSSDEDENEEEESDSASVQTAQSVDEKMIRRPKGKKIRSEKLVQERVISPILFEDREAARRERKEAKERAREEARKERWNLIKAIKTSSSSKLDALSDITEDNVASPNDNDDDEHLEEQLIKFSRKQKSEGKTHVKGKSKERAATAMADTSDLARKIKDNFRSRMATYIVSVLNPYRKTDCREGRITSNEDFKYLARKLTHFVMVKELKQLPSIDGLDCSESVKHKTKEFVRKYMAKYGGTFKRDPNDTKEY